MAHRPYEHAATGHPEPFPLGVTYATRARRRPSLRLRKVK